MIKWGFNTTSKKLWGVLSTRSFMHTPIMHVNPFTPFDLIEELDQEDVEHEKKKIHNEKRRMNGSSDKEEDRKEDFRRFKSSFFKFFETAGITVSSLVVLGFTGLLYHKVYNERVLYKISQAFDVGDATFQLAMHNRSSQSEWITRPQQVVLDGIVSGDLVGKYFLVIGEKGTGKLSAIMEAARKVEGENCAFVDAHSDPEIFRIRLGRALNFAYHEDYIGSLFSLRGPRDTTALLDIERALNKLEEVALKRVQKKGKPLVLVINNTHLIGDDVEGNKLVELLQQKAEALSGSGLVTVIFNSDDYWVYERLRKLATRLEVVNFKDLGRKEALAALQNSRMRFYNEKISDTVANQVYDLVGGRPQHISNVASHKDIIAACHALIDREKTWFLNQCALLGESMDDDVMEYGKFSVSAMLLMKQLVEISQNCELDDLVELPLWRARQIMTRADYIKVYDNLNIFAIDSRSRVRADSVPMMRAFHELYAQPGFLQLLKESAERVSAIESLNRTRELVAKDLVLGGEYKLQNSAVSLHGVNDDADDAEPNWMEDYNPKAREEVWKKRLA